MNLPAVLCLTRGFGDYLAPVPTTVWEREVEPALAGSILDERTADLNVRFRRGKTTAELDQKQGRVTIEQHLLEYAGIDQDRRCGPRWCVLATDGIRLAEYADYFQENCIFNNLTQNDTSRLPIWQYGQWDTANTENSRLVPSSTTHTSQKLHLTHKSLNSSIEHGYELHRNPRLCSLKDNLFKNKHTMRKQTAHAAS